MISGTTKQFASRCSQRGYTLDEVRPCIVSQDNDMITVDETHPAYPREVKPGFAPPQPPSPAPPTPVLKHGPGTELKKLLANIGITATPTCSCNTRARIMDENEAKEPGWCEANLETVVGWLREEATKRGLPFIDAAGRMIVKRAIKNARRAALDAPTTVNGERDADAPQADQGEDEAAV